MNVINPNYVWKLVFKIRRTNVGAEKIDSSTLKTFGMVIADFQIKDKASKSRFFQKILLMANAKFEVIFEMFFLKISNMDILFDKKTLI